MKLTIEYLDLWFGEMIRHQASKFVTGIWDADDIRQEVLIHLSRQNWTARPTRSKYHEGRVCKTHPGSVIAAIRNKCKNIRRHEQYRFTVGEVSPLLPHQRPDPLSILALKEAVMRLSGRQTRVVHARLFPPTPCAATQRQLARISGLSLATVSRTLAEAREVLETVLMQESSKPQPREHG
jgi:DNA-directed RNA polymerase specialized sigma24 family protein